jgi:hypothetical protein
MDGNSVLYPITTSARRQALLYHRKVLLRIDFTPLACQETTEIAQGLSVLIANDYYTTRY